MIYEPFLIYHLDLANKEQVLIVKNSDDPEIGEIFFSFIESYCSDKKCDCRHAYLDVLKKDGIYGNPRLIGKISFGLDTMEYHLKWFRVSKPDKIHMQYIGPSVLEIYDKSEKENLEEFVALFKKDKEYKNKFKHHYFLHKKAISTKSQENQKMIFQSKRRLNDIIEEVAENEDILSIPKESLSDRIINAMQGDTYTKQGRNELCNCGSEKKYKRCCGRV